jgi:hypothetical protein
MIDLTSEMCFGRRGKLGASLARAFASAAAVVAVTGGTVHAAATLDHAPYGMTQDGQAVEIYTMTNEAADYYCRHRLLHWCYAIVNTIRKRASPRIIRA